MVNGADVKGDLASMTGYAVQEGHAETCSWTWEIRAVNARGLDLRLRLPDGLGAMEQPLRKRLAAVVTRGAVTVSLRLAQSADMPGAGLDHAALQAALAMLQQVQATAEAQGYRLAPPSAVDVLAIKGVANATVETGLPDPATLLADFDIALVAFRQMRRSEGRALAAVLSEQIARISGLTDAAQELAAARTESQADRLRTNVAALLDATEAVDAARLAQELALLAVKSDVTEEIDRLRAHVTAARDLLAASEPVGRKLDFLMQEFNREANTLCSKSGDPRLTAIGLDLKHAIDQMREQVQNVE